MSIYVGIKDKQVYIRNTNASPETRIYFDVDKIDELKYALDKAVECIKGNPEWRII